MGTRNLQIVVQDGQVKVANYTQFDGYPGGQGLTALAFLRDSMKIEVFKQKVEQCSWMDQASYKAAWVTCGADPDSDMVGMDVADKFKANYLWLSRECGADIYNLIQASTNGLKVQNGVDFAADSLMCEWAYVVDLDKNTFEVYKGFNQTPLTPKDRFYFLSEKAHVERRGNNQYYPVKIVKSYSLLELPSDDTFIEDFKEPEED